MLLKPHSAILLHMVDKKSKKTETASEESKVAQSEEAKTPETAQPSSTPGQQPLPPSDAPVIHKLSDETPMTQQASEIPFNKVLMIFALTAIVGIASGFGLRYVLGASGKSAATKQAESKLGTGDDVKESAGIPDLETFTDQAEGKLEKGGHEDGVGTHKLIRPGGDDQTAYLTSSTVDLNEFVGKNVRVYGQTNSAPGVSWFMDVGYVEVLK